MLIEPYHLLNCLVANRWMFLKNVYERNNFCIGSMREAQVKTTMMMMMTKTTTYVLV